MYILFIGGDDFVYGDCINVLEQVLMYGKIDCCYFMKLVVVLGLGIFVIESMVQQVEVIVINQVECVSML